MPRRKTDAEFRKEVKALVGDEYAVLDKYVNTNTKLSFKHKKCNNAFEMTPHSFLQGQRCPNCRYQKAAQKRRKTDAEFRAEVRKLVGNKYVVLDEYCGNKVKLRFCHKLCGSVFKLKPVNFLRGQRCPQCTHKKTTLNKTKSASDFKKQFYRLVGKDYVLVSDYQKALGKIIVLHVKCGYLYEVRAHNFLMGNRCPNCKNKIKINNNSFAMSVKNTTNGEYKPLQKYAGARQKILMLHKKCGNQWCVTPDSFFRGARCPLCQMKSVALKKVTPFSEISSKISKISHGEYQILPKNYKGSTAKACFYHRICKNCFKMPPYEFVAGERCPFCNFSKGERMVEKYLTARRIFFKPQFTLKGCKDKRPLPFDFAVFNKDKSLNCLIEYQGRQHFYDPFTWKRKHGPFNLQSILNTQKHDAMKLQYCKDHGIKLIRINHPQTSSKSNSIEFIERLVNRTLNKELKVS